MAERPPLTGRVEVPQERQVAGRVVGKPLVEGDNTCFVHRLLAVPACFPLIGLEGIEFLSTGMDGHRHTEPSQRIGDIPLDGVPEKMRDKKEPLFAGTLAANEDAAPVEIALEWWSNLYQIDSDAIPTRNVPRHVVIGIAKDGVSIHAGHGIAENVRVDQSTPCSLDKLEWGLCKSLPA